MLRVKASYTNFNDIFNDLTYMHASGAKYFGILTTTLETYKVKYKGQTFSNQKTWHVCHKGPKWVLQLESALQSNVSKHSRTSEWDVGIRRTSTKILRSVTSNFGNAFKNLIGI